MFNSHLIEFNCFNYTVFTFICQNNKSFLIFFDLEITFCFSNHRFSVTGAMKTNFSVLSIYVEITLFAGSDDNWLDVLVSKHVHTTNKFGLHLRTSFNAFIRKISRFYHFTSAQQLHLQYLSLYLLQISFVDILTSFLLVLVTCEYLIVFKIV